VASGPPNIFLQQTASTNLHSKRSYNLSPIHHCSTRRSRCVGSLSYSCLSSQSPHWPNSVALQLSPAPFGDGPFTFDTAEQHKIASKLRLGIPKVGFFENLHPETAKALEAARGVLEKLTAGIREVEIPALPAISVPCGFTADGLPIGLQISSAPFAESKVISLAHAYEQATEWHKMRPKLGG
jgi:Asp-tRNA(Asn)/Glu-tRNA(Gln) amidotransferase A subunit family amidase